jgi:hypothetical protein
MGYETKERVLRQAVPPEARFCDVAECQMIFDCVVFVLRVNTNESLESLPRADRIFRFATGQPECEL